jgi:hypothetical protein
MDFVLFFTSNETLDLAFENSYEPANVFRLDDYETLGVQIGA